MSDVPRFSSSAFALSAQRIDLPWMDWAALFFLLLSFFHLHPGLERRQLKIGGASSQRLPHPALHLPGNDPGFSPSTSGHACVSDSARHAG